MNITSMNYSSSELAYLKPEVITNPYNIYNAPTHVTEYLNSVCQGLNELIVICMYFVLIYFVFKTIIYPLTYNTFKRLNYGLKVLERVHDVSEGLMMTGAILVIIMLHLQGDIPQKYTIIEKVLGLIVGFILLVKLITYFQKGKYSETREKYEKKFNSFAKTVREEK